MKVGSAAHPLCRQPPSSLGPAPSPAPRSQPSCIAKDVTWSAPALQLTASFHGRGESPTSHGRRPTTLDLRAEGLARRAGCRSLSAASSELRCWCVPARGEALNHRATQNPALISCHHHPRSLRPPRACHQRPHPVGPHARSAIGPPQDDFPPQKLSAAQGTAGGSSPIVARHRCPERSVDCALSLRQSRWQATQQACAAPHRPGSHAWDDSSCLRSGRRSAAPPRPRRGRRMPLRGC
jgi:hypothetical protein